MLNLVPNMKQSEATSTKVLKLQNPELTTASKIYTLISDIGLKSQIDANKNKNFNCLLNSQI